MINLNFVEFEVEGFPPAYNSGFSILNPKHSRYPLVRKLQKAAEGAMTGKPLLQGNIVLEVKHEIFMGDRRTDVVNLVGGIANVLEGIAYSNDNQIKEIHFKQIVSQRDIYKVRIKEL